MLGGGQNNNGMDFGTWWRNLQIGFKYLLIITVGLQLLSLITNGLPLIIFANYMPYTIYMFQIWRLITSFLIDFSIIQVLVYLYILYQIIIEYQKRYSTTYVLLEIIIQTLLCNSILYTAVIPLNLIGFIPEKAVVTSGLIHLVFIFLWKQAAQDPERMTKFCCFPCVIPMKIIPWIYFIFFMLFGSGGMGGLVGCLLGYCQHMYLKKSLLQIRLAHYRKFQSWLPNSMKSQPGFVHIADTQTILRTVCKQHTEAPFVDNNPFNNRPVQSQNRNPYQLTQPMNDKVQVLGKGVPIGSSSPVEAQPSKLKNYRDRWIQQAQDQSNYQRQLTKDQIQAKSQHTFEPKNQINMNESMMSNQPLNLQDQQDLYNDTTKPSKK